MNECRVCGCIGIHQYFQPQERMFGWGDKFEYFKCEECGCLQIGAPPNDLPRYYPANYYSLSNQTASLPSTFNRWINRKRLQFRLTGNGAIFERLIWRFNPLAHAIHKVVPYLKHVPQIQCDSRFLDIGCGEHSEWLGSAAQLGFTKLTGVDPFLKNPGIRHGIRYTNAPLKDLQGEFDLITLHHSLEHIPDQHDTLRQIHRLLVSGGTCIIRIPIVDSLVWNMYGLDWVELDAPRHLYLHTKTSLATLAESHGFKLTHTLFDSTEFEFAGSELYRRGIALTSPESFWVNPKSSCFSTDQMAAFRQQANAANISGESGRAAFFLNKPDTP